MKNSIQENLISFSQSWESYVAQCKVEENGKKYFRNTKEHIAHKIFIDDVPEVFMSFLDNKKYNIKSSFLAAIFFC